MNDFFRVAQAFLPVSGRNTDYTDETDLLDWNKEKRINTDMQDIAENK
ncbi:MAG TPA: hypothetical protein PLW02_13490 [Verrucomicrobiota bacterium]|nr:hypothetical protein [Verrucomicrobiota bacterium]